jgi:uncharacterized membrane protein
MMYGQLVAAEYGWAIEADRPVVRIRPRRRPTGPNRTVEIASRIALGAGIGAVIGLATLHPAPWLFFGVVFALVFGRLRDRAANNDG